MKDKILEILASNLQHYSKHNANQCAEEIAQLLTDEVIKEAYYQSPMAHPMILESRLTNQGYNSDHVLKAISKLKQ